jgi:putative NADPH-quinone reductase
MVLQLVKNTLDNVGRQYAIIDLYAEGFNPVLNPEEYRQSVDRGYVAKVPDPAIKEYQKLILQAERITFIYPTWWYGPPAILKGFFDRTFTPGFAYNFLPAPWYMKVAGPVAKYFVGSSLAFSIGKHFMPVKQHLKGKKAIVINTFGGDELSYRFFGSAPRASVDRVLLETTGISTSRVNWFSAQQDKEIPISVQKAIIAWLQQGQ